MGMRKKLVIEGMSCGHCVKHVQEALEKLDGVQSVRVSLEGKTAILELSYEVDEEKIKAVVEEIGYDVTQIK